MDWKEKLQDASSWAQDHWHEFRARSVFFQAKVGAVVAYVLVVVATLSIFPIPAPNLDVKIQQVVFGLSERTMVVIKNLDLGTLEKAEVVIHGVATDFDGKKQAGVWRTRKNHYLDEREDLRLEGRDLKDQAGRVGPASFEVTRLEVHDEDSLVAIWPRGY